MKTWQVKNPAQYFNIYFKYNFMLRNRSMKPIVLAGLAAAAYYAYTKMTPEQKENVFGSIRKTGKDLLGKLWPNADGTMRSEAPNQM